ncbi:helix-turn-helix domain-containing protein [Enterococcus termitis]|uniref:HTH cro/C1-type domain-containing protein n=1 Tax=Enterococcus termitis TaxID=332950 RepID=A0A1E5G7Z2_9ENTE|nr:helix-turn-helix transcriptional regulator [Enterococcus termitis]OEG08823.1 hypothetical protein BCR25_12890 [Enterococcus termitis]OEG08833.1 hypothetical protein BCR25_12940 [Enterococcus termitis]
MNEIRHSELISKRIQEIANEKNLTINRIAVLANLKQSTVNSIYTGQSKNPTIKTIFSICKALDISITDFLNFPPYNTKSSEIEQSPEAIMKQVRQLSNELYELEKKLEDKIND